MQKIHGWIIILGGITACTLLRILPFRPPNIEPIMATHMPFAKKFGPFSGFVFAVAAILLYDLTTGTIGTWTLVTAPAYGIVALGAAHFLKRMPAKRQWLWYGSYAFIATIFFDAITGLTVGPLFFNQPFMVALIGQIPFTIMHLIGNVPMAMLFSPAIAYGLERLSAYTPRVSYAH